MLDLLKHWMHFTFIIYPYIAITTNERVEDKYDIKLYR